jgi:ubiquinone/menaquinone biosynthesis C-methylase UbiE
VTGPLAPPKEITERLFDAIAGRYDCSGPNLYPAMGARLVELAAPKEGERVLDVATGRGAALLPAAKRVGASGRVTGIDLSAGMVAETSAAIARLGLANADLLKMDAEHLEFADDSFDVVFCSQAVLFFPDVDAALREIRRVTRPGGTLALSTFGGRVPLFDPALPLLVKDLEAHPGALRMPDAVLFSHEQVRDLFAGAGFARMEVTDEIREVVYPTLDLWWEFLLTFRPRPAILGMEEDERLRFRDSYFERLKPLLREDGLHISADVVYAWGTKP